MSLWDKLSLDDKIESAVTTYTSPFVERLDRIIALLEEVAHSLEQLRAPEK